MRDAYGSTCSRRYHPRAARGNMPCSITTTSHASEGSGGATKHVRACVVDNASE